MPRCSSVSQMCMIVTGHVAINPDQIGLVAVDNRTRANHIQIQGNRGIFDWAPLLIYYQNSQ